MRSGQQILDLRRFAHFAPESMRLVKNRVLAAAWSLQTVYDLAAKWSVRLRFDFKNLTSKCASLRFTCNRHLGSKPHDGVARTYGGRGLMIYWHVERKSTCIYSTVENLFLLRKWRQ
jgi:TnpA family transposase